MSTIQGKHCVLKGGPPAGHASGDNHNGCSIAVTDSATWYHQLGSPAKDKIDPKKRGIWVHRYERGKGSLAERAVFHYRDSEVSWEDPEERKAFDLTLADLRAKYGDAQIDRLMSGYRMG